jgi:hypothetical protein
MRASRPLHGYIRLVKTRNTGICEKLKVGNTVGDVTGRTGKTMQ